MLHRGSGYRFTRTRGCRRGGGRGLQDARQIPAQGGASRLSLNPSTAQERRLQTSQPSSRGAGVLSRLFPVVRASWEESTTRTCCYT